MRKLAGVVWLLVLVGCGGPVLQNAPAPNPTHVAAAAAGAAAAMTLADPDAATRKPEVSQSAGTGDGQTTDVPPSEVLDALDRAEAAKKRP